jgi:hypothetical protein
MWKASTGTEFEVSLLSKRSLDCTEENRTKSKDTGNQVGFCAVPFKCKLTALPLLEKLD